MQVQTSVYSLTLATKGWQTFEGDCRKDGMLPQDIDKLAAEILNAQLPIIHKQLESCVAVADDELAISGFGEAMDRALTGDQNLRLLLEVSIICLTRPTLHALVAPQVERLVAKLVWQQAPTKRASAARRAWLLTLILGSALRWPTAVEHLSVADTSQLVAWSMRQARQVEKSEKKFPTPEPDSALIMDSSWYARFLPGDHIREPYRNLLATKGVAGLDHDWLAAHLMKSTDEVRELFPQIGAFRKTLMDGFNTAIRDAYLTVFSANYPHVGNSGALWTCLRSLMDSRNETFHRAILEHQRHTLNPDPGYFRRTWKRTTVLNCDFEADFFDVNLGLRFIAAFEYAQLIGFPYLAVWLSEAAELPFGEIFHGALDA